MHTKGRNKAAFKRMGSVTYSRETALALGLDWMISRGPFQVLHFVIGDYMAGAQRQWRVEADGTLPWPE